MICMGAVAEPSADEAIEEPREVHRAADHFGDLASDLERL